MNKTIKKISYYFLAGTMFMQSFAGAAAAAPAAGGNVPKEVGKTPLTSSAAEIGASYSSLTDNYTMKLFDQDTVLKNPNADAAGYIYMFDGTSVVDPVILDLWYSYSPTTKSALSMMSVSVNDIPVSSRALEETGETSANQPLSGQAGLMHNWQVAIPAKALRAGENAISINVVHRSIDGLCRDIDDPGNWFIIRPETRVNFQLIRAPYSLANFPRPFIDEYLASKINTAFYLPANPDNDILAGVFDIASSWGAKGMPDLPKRMEVRFGDPGQVPANEIVLSQGAAALDLTQLPDGMHRLTITGEDSKSLLSTLKGLTRQQAVQTLPGTHMDLRTPLPQETENKDYFGSKKSKKGLYTLRDLGFTEDITAAGAFHQEADLEIPRPSNFGVGDGSYIELHFRHSPILDPKKSAVTIYVNNIPVRAQALTAENAEHGVLKAPIPESELDKPSWAVRFGFYHDLGIIDCSKRYDEVAWSVVEKGTSVYLEPGDVYHEVSWNYFPGDFGNEDQDKPIELTMLLPDQPTQEELTSAFKLAYYIGHQNKQKINWQVQKASAFDASKANGSVIAIGRNDSSEWSAVKDALPVLPDHGSYHLASWVDAAADGLGNFDICTIGRINNEKLVYAFMYSTPERLNHLLDLMIGVANPLSGQVSLVNAQGQVVSFDQPSGKTGSMVTSWLHKLLSITDNVGGIYVFVILLVLAGTGGVLFYMRRRSR